MPKLRYGWRDGDGDHELELVPVAGTGGTPFLFGAEPNRRPIDIRDFHITSTPVTQALWAHVMGSQLASGTYHPRRPVDNISWNDITGPDGFLDRINARDILTTVAAGDDAVRFRLPSEVEWEYAARGGPRWTDEFVFSGSNDIDEVAWYGFRFSSARRLVCRVLGWRLGWRLTNRPRGWHEPTHPQDVALKKPNQLGLYDMCGNVWEWCQDACGDGERRVRGGSHHNWDIHCTVSFRYGISADRRGDTGFRLVLA